MRVKRSRLPFPGSGRPRMQQPAGKETLGGPKSLRNLLVLVVAGFLTAGFVARSPLQAAPDKPQGDSPALRSGTSKAEAKFARLPLRFEPNHGQSAAEVAFLARGAGYSMFLSPEEFVLGISTTALRFRPVGANPAPRIQGMRALPGKTNYLLGSDGSRWSKAVPAYGGVEYKDLYPGIDLVFHGKEGLLEYDFVIHPGADHKLIGLAVEGARSLRLNGRGDLILQTALGPIVQPKPVIYQMVDGRRRTVKGGYLIGKERFAFRIGAYDRDRPLVIDPVVPFSSYLGGTGDDGAHAVAMDGKGNTYVTGWTSSSDFPTRGEESGYSDASGQNAPSDPASPQAGGLYSDPSGANRLGDFPTGKIGRTSSGSPVALSVLCGGVGRGGNLAGGGSSIAGISGDTSFMGGGGCGDIFIAKLDPSGSRLIYSTYLGGSGADAGVAIAVDSSGSTYVTGHTTSADFPVTPGAAQPALSGVVPDAFLIKLDAAGSKVEYGTYLGGTLADSGNAVAVDSAGKVYVAGAAGLGLPTKSAVQPASNGVEPDAFVAKFDPAAAGADSLVYATYLGSPFKDAAYGIAVDKKGSAYVTGYAGEGFPVKRALQPKFGGTSCRSLSEGGLCPDAFVAKLHPAGSALDFSTYLGGKGNDAGMGIALDEAGAVHLAGIAGPGFPTKNAFRKKMSGTQDAFFAKMPPSGQSLSYSTYLGGTGIDSAAAVAVDGSGRAYVVGTAMPGSSTKPLRFPVKGAVQAGHSGGGHSDAFVASFDPSRSGQASVRFSTNFGGGGNDFGNGIAVSDSGTAAIAGATASVVDFPSFSALQPKSKGDSEAFVAKISPSAGNLPVVQQLSPRSGPIAGGTEVVIKGKNLHRIKAVNFGNKAVEDFKVDDDNTRLTLRAPARSPGDVNVSATADKQGAKPTPAGRFTYGVGAWTPAQSMKVARSWPEAVPLKDGRVLLAGGCLERIRRNDACVRATASAEIYAPESKRWSSTGKMTIARHAGFAAVLLPDGKVLVVGGSGPAGELLTSAEVYNPATGKWAAVPALPGVDTESGRGSQEHITGAQQGSRRFSATLLADGKVLVLGYKAALLYLPRSGKWAPALASGEEAPAFTLDHSAVLLRNGKVLIAEDQSFLYDPATKKFEPTGQSPISRFSKSATLLADGKVLVAGGRPNYERVSLNAEIFDPAATDPQDPRFKGAWKLVPDLTVGRYDHAAVRLPDGRVFLAGGTYTNGGRIEPAELYDPKNNKWIPGGNLPTAPGRGATATALEDGTVLVAGSAGRSASIYDPAPGDSGPLSTSGGPRSVALIVLVVAVLAAGGLAVRARTRRRKLGSPDV